MTTEPLDPRLQTLFAEARQELDGEALTGQVMAQTRKLRYLLFAGGITAAFVLLAGTWLLLAIPLLEFAVLVSQVLTTTLVELGEGWLALAFMPVNNIAGLLALTAKAIHFGRKKIISASFAN